MEVDINLIEFERVATSFAKFHQVFAPLFGRTEARERSEQYLRGLPGRPCWLALRRDLDGSEAKYYLSNAPEDTPLRRLAEVGAMRWPIETEFQTDKGETGLDEYEVRTWSGWHHHVTMALLAGAFLLDLQLDWGEK
jgi:SRSO17 transposase